MKYSVRPSTSQIVESDAIFSTTWFFFQGFVFQSAFDNSLHDTWQKKNYLISRPMILLQTRVSKFIWCIYSVAAVAVATRECSSIRELFFLIRRKSGKALFDLKVNDCL